MSDFDITPEEVINTAIYNEKLAADHYKNLSELFSKVGNGPVAAFFSEHSKREVGHFNSLMKYKERNFSESTLVPGEYVKWVTDEMTSGEGTSVTADVDHALKNVEDAEKSAEKFYQKAASSIDDKSLVELFEKLAREEAHHFYLAQKVRSIMESKGTIEPSDYDDLGVG